MALFPGSIPTGVTVDPTTVQLTFHQYSGILHEIQNSSVAYSTSLSQIVSTFIGAITAMAFVLACTRGRG